MSKDLQEEVTTMIYNYGLGVGPDSGTLACRIISKVKRSLTPLAPDRAKRAAKSKPSASKRSKSGAAGKA